MKVWCRLSSQNRNGIFELFSLLLKQDGLSPRGIQQRFFFRNVQPGSHAAFVAGVHQLQTFLQRLDGAVQNCELAIELAKSEIIASKLRGDYQANVFEISRACLVRRLRRFNAAPPPPKQIDFVPDRERQDDIVLRDRRCNRKVAVGWPVSRKPLTLCVGSGRKCRKLRGDLERGGSTRLLQPRGRNLDGLICVKRLFFQSVQFVIVKGTPPLAFGNPIFGGTFAPGFGNVPLCGHRCRGALVFWPNGATTNEDTNAKPDQGTELPVAIHYCFLAPGAGFGCAAGWLGPRFVATSLTRTSCPSSRESAGFSTIQSLTSSP